MSTQEIADRLTTGQRSAIRYGDQHWAVLRCSEATARRLCVANTKRPALFECQRASAPLRTDDKGRPEPQYDQFRLTEAGLTVQAAL